jgi:hypothetical protein
VACIVVMILIAHLLAPAPNDWTQDLISELASQGYALVWIMSLGFIGFGILVGFSWLIYLETTGDASSKQDNNG